MVKKCLILLLNVPKTQGNALQKITIVSSDLLLYAVRCLNCCYWIRRTPTLGLSQCLLLISRQNYVRRSLCTLHIWSPSFATATWVGVVLHQKPAYVAQYRDTWRALLSAITNLLLHTVRGISWLASPGHCCMQLASNHSIIRRRLIGTTDRA
jgi:hypothetical protein